MSKQEVLNAFATLKSMCRDRGFEAPEITEEAYTNSIVFSIDVAQGNTRIIFNLDQKFKMQSIKSYLQDDDLNIILVYRDTSALIKPKDKVVTAPGLSFTTFTLRQLQFNPTEHQETPKHELIRDPRRIQAICDRYNTTVLKLPRIQVSDPIIQYLGGIHGDLVKIHRNSDSNGFCTTYSYVTNALIK